jgi:PAS domain-containing protein
MNRDLKAKTHRSELMTVTEADKSGKQKAAEADVESFRKELGPFVVAAETTGMPMVFTDAKEPGHPIVFANDSFLRLTGYRREEVLAQIISFLSANIGPAELALIETAFVKQDGTSTPSQ